MFDKTCGVLKVPVVCIDVWQH